MNISKIFNKLLSQRKSTQEKCVNGAQVRKQKVCETKRNIQKTKMKGKEHTTKSGNIQLFSNQGFSHVRGKKKYTQF